MLCFSSIIIGSIRLKCIRGSPQRYCIFSRSFLNLSTSWRQIKRGRKREEDRQRGAGMQTQTTNGDNIEKVGEVLPNGYVFCSYLQRLNYFLVGKE